MKNLFIVIIIVLFVLNANAQSYRVKLPVKAPGTYLSEDVFGHNYKSEGNLYKDSDKDGYINLYDRHDSNPNVGYFSEPTRIDPSYYQNYTSSSFDYGRNQTIYEGERGGQYYINKNGNKTYMKHN